MIKLLEKYPVLSICLLVAIMLMPNIDSLNITIMEARNFITAREIVTDGNKPAMVWFKGLNSEIDSYSAFKDNAGNSLGFDLYLQSLGITDLYICGLALDYCVKFTTIDAKLAGFNVTVLRNLTKAVEPENFELEIVKLIKDYHINIETVRS